MKKYLLFLLIIVFTFSLNAQNPEYLYGINDTIKCVPAIGMKEYYYYRNLAELAIVDNDLDKASEYYLKAFEYKSKPFVKDFTRAFLAEYLGGRDSLEITKLLIQSRSQYAGDKSGKDWFKNYIDFYPGLDSIKYKTSLINILDTIPKAEDIYNKALQNELDIMFEEDQEVRKKSDKSEISKVDSINMVKLISLYEKYGNITESNSYSMNALNMILIHGRENIDRWYPIIKKQVYNGSMDSRMLIDILSNNYMFRYGDTLSHYFGHNCGFEYNFKYVMIKFSKEKEKLVNDIRAKFFIESYLNEEKKKLWQYQTQCKPEFAFYSNTRFVMPIQFIYTEEELTDEKIEELKKEEDKMIEQMREKYKGIYDLRIFEKDSKDFNSDFFISH